MLLYSINLVTSEYSKLQEAIGDLGNMINNNLERQRHEIEREHRSQLKKFQVDLDNLHSEKSRLEESIATNERANQLEEERDWFKKEALRLDKILEQTKARQKELMERLDESEQDRKWMKSQIEKVTEHNWELQKKLKERDTNPNALSEEENADKEAAEGSSEVETGLETRA